MNDLELIKSKVDIVDFIGEYITLKKGGRNFKALCPFHSEKTPSFYVSPERQTWHCFGACSQGGDIFDFLVKWDHIDFRESIKILAQKAGVKLSAYSPSPEEKEKDRLYEINHLASEFFHFLLTKHQIGKYARNYLEKRGIKDKIVNTFTLGYAPNTWDALLKYLRKKNYKDGEIVEAGLAIRGDRGSLYDRFRGRLIFTLKDHLGKTIGFSGRKIGKDEDKDLPAGRSEAKYINSPETPIYIKGNVFYGLDQTKESIKKEKYAIVVEGEFDFLSSFQAGITNVVAIKGSALTEGQAKLIKRFTDTILLALDSDFAGNEAAKKGIEVAENESLTIKVIKLEYGKDPDECIQKSPSLWKRSINNAVNIYDFILDKAFQTYDPNDSVSKKKIGDEVVPFIAKIENPIVYSHYQRLLAKKLDISEEAVGSLIDRQKSKKEIQHSSPIVADKRPRKDLLDDFLLTLILGSIDPKKSLEEVSTIIEPEDFSQPSIAIIIEELKKYFLKHDKLDIKIFGKVLTAEIAPTFDRAYLLEIDSSVSDETHFTNLLKKTAKEIKKISLRRRINNLSTNLRQGEDNLKKLQTLIQKIALLDKENV
ncbi:DNA primase [Candidatus Gottesmanbacteria bacterium]|nr:DNA primase [Candidatus Gottesmanbacteria bacterium]